MRCPTRRFPHLSRRRNSRFALEHLGPGGRVPPGCTRFLSRPYPADAAGNGSDAGASASVERRSAGGRRCQMADPPVELGRSGRVQSRAHDGAVYPVERRRRRGRGMEVGNEVHVVLPTRRRVGMVVVREAMAAATHVGGVEQRRRAPVSRSPTAPQGSFVVGSISTRGPDHDPVRQKISAPTGLAPPTARRRAVLSTGRCEHFHNGPNPMPRSSGVHHRSSRETLRIP